MVTKYYQYVGKAIRNARKQHHLTQQDVADKLGIKRSLYSQYERGACSISMKTWWTLAELLGLDPVSVAEEALKYERS